MAADSVTGFLRHGAGGTDVLDVNGFGLDFTTIQAFMADVGGNCVFTLNGADILTVNGVPRRNSWRPTLFSESRHTFRSITRHGRDCHRKSGLIYADLRR